MITYNHEQFITQAVESALKQQVNFDYEIVVGEDCSTDSTRAILQALQAAHPTRLRLVLPTHNLGPHRNFVNVLQACQGQYVALLEGDDYWIDPHKLQKQVDFLEAHPQCAMSCHDGWMLVQEGGEAVLRPYPVNRKPFMTLQDLLSGNNIVTGSVVFRRGLFSTLPALFYDLHMADWTLHVLNARHGQIAYLDEKMSVYRVHGAGIWSSASQLQQLHERLRFYKAINPYLNFEYNRVIRRAEAKILLEASAVQAYEGKLPQARRDLLRSVWQHPLNSALVRPNVFRIAAKVMLPGFYRQLTRLRRLATPRP